MEVTQEGWHHQLRYDVTKQEALFYLFTYSKSIFNILYTCDWVIRKMNKKKEHLWEVPTFKNKTKKIEHLEIESHRLQSNQPETRDTIFYFLCLGQGLRKGPFSPESSVLPLSHHTPSKLNLSLFWNTYYTDSLGFSKISLNLWIMVSLSVNIFHSNLQEALRIIFFFFCGFYYFCLSI